MAIKKKDKKKIEKLMLGEWANIYDLIRRGRSDEVGPDGLSAVLEAFQKKINEIIDIING